MACVNLHKMPALTFAFNIIMMCFLLAVAKQKTNVATIAWLLETDDYAVPSVSEEADDGVPADFMFFIHALFRGVGQFIFIDTTVGGALVVIGIAISSRYSGLAVLCGSFIGCINSRYVLRVPPSSWVNIRNGIYGFNCAGIFAAMAGDVFFKVNWGGVLMGAVGSFLVGLVSLALASFFDSDETGVPFLTLPFCITTWIMLLTRTQHLIPKTTGDLDDLLYQDNDRADRLFANGFGQRSGHDVDNKDEVEDVEYGSPGMRKARVAATNLTPTEFDSLPVPKLKIKTPNSEGRWNDRSPRQSLVDSFRASANPVYRANSFRTSPRNSKRGTILVKAKSEKGDSIASTPCRMNTAHSFRGEKIADRNEISMVKANSERNVQSGA